MSWTGFNQDGWNPDNYAGAGPVESFVQTVDSLEPDKTTLMYGLLLPLAVLLNAAFILFVARRPVREPSPTGN
ncbi:hypothetical protein UK23_20090 [Lentzea aerocolonigenes]|uniref:Uncharacterized protein n=1 Tax=Lentzea aerocolonigenes TaxID=68170 RepID=A0A0F0GVJ4_LENAE|nr:hypothetical protein [Lentzea aerocolonigenes]KJK47469.1 hypothetical protein UK23_20090 [Lentzea aerocolonigenes]